ncbi:MAG: glutamate formimidoyltransferase [Gemmatimonadetes bacterium]|nr:glutamate formimidoyltransferase [Gemmatimonadota bacterium]
MTSIEWVECVPNFSEGRDPSFIDDLAAAIESVPEAHILDIHRDTWHHRSVFTIVGELGAVRDATFQAVRLAVSQIDLTRHTGEHPRIGAADVVPFAPIGDTPMESCVMLARQIGRLIGEELQVPVFLYGRAATRPDRRLLSGIRRGEFESLTSTLSTSPLLTPDFGPRAVHPSAGATAVGARKLLVAFNVFLDSSDSSVADRIAKRIRASDGGLPDIQAKGFEVDGRAQVSMNLLDPAITTPAVAYEAVNSLAQQMGIRVTQSEFVGLVPESAVDGIDEEALKLQSPLRDQLLEPKVRAVGGSC